MNQRAVNSDAFVPFEPPSTAATKAPPATANLKVVPAADAPPAFAPLAMARAQPHVHASAGADGKPSVTLQRDGDRVTGIRVECACGQVIELECSY